MTSYTSHVNVICELYAYMDFACILWMVQVLLSDVHNPVLTEHRVQSSISSRVLSWLPLELQRCNLRVQIDLEEYPPCIHMDLKYDNSSVKPEVNTTLKILSHPMSFTVNVPGVYVAYAVNSVVVLNNMHVFEDAEKCL